MEKTSALIITFNPTDSLARKLDSLYKEFNQVILVDNGSETEIKDTIKTQVEIRGSSLYTILNEENLGIASALNQGFPSRSNSVMSI